MPVRRLCGRFGADYGFVLSLVPVSYGQQFTGYHRTAINLGYLALVGVDAVGVPAAVLARAEIGGTART